MSMPMRREQRGLVPDLLDWLEVPFAALRPPMTQPIKFEDYVKDGRYVLRRTAGNRPGKGCRDHRLQRRSDRPRRTA